MAMVLAGFSFDAYTEIERSSGVWISDGGVDEPGIQGVQVVMLSPQFVRDGCRGILRVRVLAAEGLRGVSVGGSVTVTFRIELPRKGSFVGSARCSTRRGVLNGIARWLNEDESVYVYAPRDVSGRQNGEADSDDLNLVVEVRKRNLMDTTSEEVIAKAAVPFSEWGTGNLREVTKALELLVPVGDQDKVNPFVNLQLQYDEFGEVAPAISSEAVTGGFIEGGGEILDEVTPEMRMLRQSYGSAVPSYIMAPRTDKISYEELQKMLRRRALPCVGEDESELRLRLQKTIDAEESLRRSESSWGNVEWAFGADNRQALEGVLGSASSMGEMLSGDFFGALGAGFKSGVTEVPGMKELFSGDFSGALEQRKKIMQMSKTQEGRDAIQSRVDGAMKRAKQQAMLRLANGMELMSVRRGAWKMLEQAVLEEGGGSFAEYEPLCYLEARETNTECWVWRYRPGKRLVVAFRGTSDFGDVLTDIAAIPRDIGELGFVHEGFSRAYESIREGLIAALHAGFGGADGKGWEILFTGHSLGGALATLSSLDVAREALRSAAQRKSIRVAVHQADSELLGAALVNAEKIACTFGAPRVGGARMCAACDECVPKSWRIWSSSDIVPTVPPTTLFGFRHAGIGIELDPSSSELKVRGRTPGLSKFAATERAEAIAEAIANGILADGKQNTSSKGVDVWAAWNAADIEQLRLVMGKGTTAVSEHMEDNYFERLAECLSAQVTKTAEQEGKSWFGR